MNDEYLFAPSSKLYSRVALSTNDLRAPLLPLPTSAQRHPEEQSLKAARGGSPPERESLCARKEESEVKICTPKSYYAAFEKPLTNRIFLRSAGNLSGQTAQEKL